MGSLSLNTVETFLLAEDLIIMNKNFVDAEKFITFASLHREFEERELLQEINTEYDASKH